MAHQLLVAYELRRLQAGGKGDLLFLPGGGEEDGAPLDLFVQGVGALLSNELLGLQPGEEQGAVGQVGQVGGLIQNDLEVLFTLLRGGVRSRRSSAKPLIAVIGVLNSWEKWLMKSERRVWMLCSSLDILLKSS